ncbi:Concanavalin A-like lectin/glucanases superfamily protein [uncultured archaeon]|nr:Concanavalin A-like lectin/glucanases superfamily protein [uncultured archaeon]
MKNSRSNEAISQIIGEIILLAITVTSVSVIAMQILSTPGPQDTTIVTIIGKIEGGHPVFELQRGENLSRDTKLIINISERYNYSEYTLYDFQKYIHDQKWNIGEQIILPQGNITGLNDNGPRVEATIIDTKTNAIVFWGILQEGIITRYKGGIWHFNESYWSGIYHDVNDSSGNSNHGIAKPFFNKPKIINGIDKNGGYFDKTNYIEVPTKWSINITDHITVAAWMKPYTSDFISYTSTLPNKFGFTPYIINVADNIYAIISEEQGSAGLLQTMNITSNGENVTIIPYHGEARFGYAQGNQRNLRPIITKIKEKILNTPSMVLIAYNNNSGGNKFFTELRTYNISNNGSIYYTKNYLTLPEQGPSNGNRPNLQKITDTLCVIAYQTNNGGGIIKTLTISSNGTITPTNYNYLEPTLSEPNFFPINKNIYGLAYRGSSNKGIIKTFNFNNSTGYITNISSWNYSETAAFQPCVRHVSGNIFAVVYRSDTAKGIVKTFEILPNGRFGPTPEYKNITLAKVNCYTPWIVHDVADTYSVVYSDQDDTGNNAGCNGYYIELELGKNGSIKITDSGKTFEQERCYSPIILPINEHIFVIVYKGPSGGGSGHPGWLITVAYPGMKGIFKGDAFFISSNTTQVEGSINNVKIYYNDTDLGENWHHISLTYDGTNIILFVHDINGGLINKTSKYYPNHKITLTPIDLYLGRNYYGYIDEIAIYEKALNDCQINYISQHLHEQRMLEYYLLGNNCWPIW